ncbi:MAG: type 2 isopentenyl-diphosphate Delta-isomerase [Myxococcales bacterium]|nr:type 2 isopentenyl-diphosphate Delta-isomerase [Myxococcales bacterium]
MPDIRARKASHLDLCATDDVAFSTKTTLLEQVHLVHDALPELDVDTIDLHSHVVGLPVRAPLVIAAMTGGIQRAESVNRALAEVAEALGIAFGFGSMRPLLEDGITLGYRVRDIAPTAVLFGNLGVVQARSASDQQLVDLVGTTGVSALALHLNPAQEVVQDGGDTDFTGALDTFARVREVLDVPVFAKETGCGISQRVAERLRTRGIEWVDVGGAGGTSWVGVETLRARAATERLGRLFWDWGIPTAASVIQVRRVGLRAIATGGIHNGLDVARSIALGASAAGMARPFLQALNAGGPDQARRFAEEVLHELRVAMLLTGSADIAALQAVPRVLGPDLERWAR